MRSEKHEEATRCSLRLCSRDAVPLRALAQPSTNHTRSSAALRLARTIGPRVLCLRAWVTVTACRKEGADNRKGAHAALRWHGPLGCSYCDEAVALLESSAALRCGAPISEAAQRSALHSSAPLHARPPPTHAKGGKARLPGLPTGHW